MLLTTRRPSFTTLGILAKFELGLLGAVEDTGTAELYFSYTRIYHTYTDKTPDFEEGDLEVDLDRICKKELHKEHGSNF